MSTINTTSTVNTTSTINIRPNVPRHSPDKDGDEVKPRQVVFMRERDFDFRRRGKVENTHQKSGILRGPEGKVFLQKFTPNPFRAGLVLKERAHTGRGVVSKVYCNWEIGNEE